MLQLVAAAYVGLNYKRERSREEGVVLRILELGLGFRV